MQVEHVKDPLRFPTAAGDFLSRREAENNLMLGLIADIAAGRREGTGDPALYVARDAAGDVAGAALWAGYSLILSRGTPQSHAALADFLFAHHAAPPAISGPADAAAAFALAWLDRTRLPHAPGPVMRLMQTSVPADPPTIPSGIFRRATADDLPRALAWAQAFAEELNVRAGVQPDRVRWLVEHGRTWLWCDPQPVAMAAAVSVVGDGARVGAVFTPPQLRRNGYASACVAALTRQLLRDGSKAVYLYAESQNKTTNHIYESLGYRFVSDWQEYDMNPTPT